MENNAWKRGLELPLRAGKRGGVVTILLLIVVVLAAVGGGAYYYQQHQDESYATDTAQLAAEISRSIQRLGEQSTADETRRIRGRMAQYFERSDADPKARDAWLPKLEAWDSESIEREQRLTDLLGQVRDFPLDSSLEETEALDAEVQAMSERLDPESRSRLQSAWAPRKRRIQERINSVSATILARTIPSGAATYLNGEYVGQSSLGIQNARGGKHTIAFEKEGYAREEIEVEVSESGEIDLGSVELQLLTSPVRIRVTGGKQRGEISISLEKSDAEDADVLLYFEAREGRDVEFENAPIGSLQLGVTVDGRLALDREIQVERGEENVYEYTLD